MADLPSTQALIQLEEVQFQDSMSESLMTKLGSAINYLLDNSVTDDLGTIIESVLTEAQFQEVRDDTWVLVDGRDVTGTDLDTTYSIDTLPDMTDKFARVVDDGVAIDTGRVVATEQDSQNVSHVHQLVSNTGSSGSFGSSTGIAVAASDGGGATSLNGDDAAANSGQASAQGSDDFKPRNVTVNYFIKINI